MPRLSEMTCSAHGCAEHPDQTPSAYMQGPANPFGDKGQRDRFGRQLDQLYPAPQDAPPDAFSHVLRRIAVLMDHQS